MSATKQDKMVAVYWTPVYVKALDKLAAKLGLKRNEFIKMAVKKEVERVQKTGRTSVEYVQK